MVTTFPVVDEDRTRERLSGCLELARRPGTPGEETAACTAIGRIVLANPWLTTGMIVHTTAPPWRDLVTACSRYRHLLTPRETEFLASLWRFPRLSEKQASWLRAIEQRLRSHGCSL